MGSKKKVGFFVWYMDRKYGSYTTIQAEGFLYTLLPLSVYGLNRYRTAESGNQEHEQDFLRE